MLLIEKVRGGFSTQKPSRENSLCLQRSAGPPLVQLGFFCCQSSSSSDASDCCFCRRRLRPSHGQHQWGGGGGGGGSTASSFPVSGPRLCGDAAADGTWFRSFRLWRKTLLWFSRFPSENAVEKKPRSRLMSSFDGRKCFRGPSEVPDRLSFPR